MARRGQRGPAPVVVGFGAPKGRRRGLMNERPIVEDRRMIDPRQPDFQNVPGSPGRGLYRYGTELDARSTPLVSLVTPVWDTPAALLQETWACVRGQSLRRTEWVLVDDGSTRTDTLGALEELSREPGVRVVRHGENRGLPASRNTGFRSARAEMVFLLDSDDLIEPTTLEKCLWRLLTHPREGFTKGYSVGFGGQTYLWARGFELLDAFLERNHVDTTAMIRRGVHERLGGYDETLRTGPDDWDFWVRAGATGVWGSTIPEYLDWYRRRRSGVVGWNTVDREARREWFVGRLRERHPRLFEPGGFERAVRGAREVPGGEREAGEDPPPPAIVNPIASVPGGPRRALVVVEAMRLGVENGVCPVRLGELLRAGWEVTIVATGEALEPARALAQCDPRQISERDPHADLALIGLRTPDVFVARSYVPRDQVERFTAYLAASRRVDQVIHGLPPGPGAARGKGAAPETARAVAVALHHAAA